jgi:hypothetical protein
MLVLLHFHTLGFTPVQLAYLFVLYEIAGMVTNLSAGWIAARFGLTSTLYAGLGLQVVALLALAQLDPAWAVGPRSPSSWWCRALGRGQGPGQDVLEIGGEAAGARPRAGLFPLGGAADRVEERGQGPGLPAGRGAAGDGGFVWAVLGMAAVLAVILVAVLIAMPPGLPKGRKGAKFSEVFSKSANVNWLSAARVFLFGARDVWFVVGIPIYFYAVLSDGTTEGNRAAFFMIGTFMAVWIILYGAVQANAPRLLRAAARPEARADRGGARLGLGAGGGAGALAGAALLAVGRTPG